MKYIIAAASRHGATRGIADAIATTLASQGHLVEVISPAELREDLDADGLIVGSGVYMGGWLKEMVQALPTITALAERIPLWVFSSGPLGDPPVPEGIPERVTPHLESLKALPLFRDHQLFAGSLDRSVLSRKEKLVLAMVKAPAGDFRPWTTIADWATSIGTANTSDR